MADALEYRAVIPVANLQIKEVDKPNLIPPEALKALCILNIRGKQLSWKILSHRDKVSFTVTWNIASDGTSDRFDKSS